MANLKQIKIFLGAILVLCIVVPIWFVVKGLDIVIYIVETIQKITNRLKR